MPFIIGIAVRPEDQIAVVGLESAAGVAGDVAAGLGQNRSATEGAGQVGIQVDVAAVNADRPGDAGITAHGDVSRIAFFA